MNSSKLKNRNKYENNSIVAYFMRKKQIFSHVFWKNALQEKILWYHFSMKLLVWLWNPWEQYYKTRHNVGFLMIDMFREQQNFPAWQSSDFHAVVSAWIIWGEKVILMKPLTYMNLSGQAVSRIMHFYKIPLQDLMVVSDDIDMDFAKIRYREKWSHGGQNGLKNIIAQLWSDNFSRVKVGIGRHEYISVSDWVLSKFSQEEIDILQRQVYLSVEEKVLYWIKSWTLCA